MITERPGIGPTAIAVAAGAGFGGVTLATAASSSVSATVVVVVGIVWALLPLAVARRGHGSADRSRPSLDPPDVESPQPNLRRADQPMVTTLIRLTDEPFEVARTSILLAAESGPTMVVTADTALGDLCRPDVQVVVAATIEGAIEIAVEQVTSAWVLIGSARAVPQMAECSASVEESRSDADWMVGRSRVIGGDVRAGSRRLVGERLRSLVRSGGLWLWEPDAVLLRTGLLREHPVVPGQPLGAWLRLRASEGRVGVASDRVISVRTEPLTGTAGWSFTMSRQRAMAAELTDAIRHGGAHHRLAALAVLARELSPLALLALSTPWWVTIATGRFPLAMSPGLFLMCCSLLAVTRYWAMRRMVGVAPKPTADLWSLVASIPAAFVASGAVLWWRPFRRRSSGVERPLIWSALALTLFTGAGLVGQASTERTSPVSVVFSVITLVVLWVIGLRSMVERSWERSGVRVRLDLPAQVDGHDAVVVDGSLEGLALQLSRSVPAPDVGQSIVIEVITSEGGLHVDGEVVFRHVAKGVVIAGVSLDHRGAVPRAWLGVLARGLSGEESRRRARPKLGAVASAGSARPTRSWHDRVLGAAAVAISLVVLAGLGMVLSGIEPHVIRSGSMVPTFEIGDVVLSERVLPSEVDVGEVVTRPPSAEWGESLTHRVTAISVQSDGYTVRTQGDANEVGERWSIAADVWLGRTVGSIPMVGSLAVAVRSGVGSVAVLAAAVLLAWFAIRRPRTGSDDQVEVSDCQISTQRRHAGRSSGA